MSSFPISAYRRTKMLATLGPASTSLDVLRGFVLAGLSGVRLNFSHGTHADHRQTLNMLKTLQAEMGYPITILQDLQGPKIRLGEVDGAVTLQAGKVFTLDDSDKPGDEERACLPHPQVLDALKVGDRVYINDGQVRLKVTSVDAHQAVCEVIAGGVISSRKGVNLPGVDLPFSALTDKDREDLAFGLENKVDWVALSFVQRPQDIREAREIIGDRAAIMAKIELPKAVERIEGIVEEADGIMIARGDLGVELPLEEVPAIQKKIIRICRDAGKPVVVATQMLESMIHNASPTRAEVSDVANAVYEGADCLMLSAETAAGAHPEAAVTTMASIIHRVEHSSALWPLLDARAPEVVAGTPDAISAAACYTAKMVNACAIVTFTEFGATALRLNRWRPEQPLLAVTPHAKTAQGLTFSWGLKTVVSEPPMDTDQLVEFALTAVKKSGLGNAGDTVVITAGIPFGKAGGTNLLRIAELP